MEWKADIPRRKQIYEVLEERIADGTCTPGERPPSVVDPCAEPGVAQVAARRVAQQELRPAGPAYTEPGIGTSVTPLPTRES